MKYCLTSKVQKKRNLWTLIQSFGVKFLHGRFFFLQQGFQSGPVPGTFTRQINSTGRIVPAEITEPPKISGGQNHKYDGRLACGIFIIKN